MEARAESGAHRDRDRGRPSEGRLKDESGSILVLFAILLTVFILCDRDRRRRRLLVGEREEGADRRRCLCARSRSRTSAELGRDSSHWDHAVGLPRSECEFGSAEYVIDEPSGAGRSEQGRASPGDTSYLALQGPSHQSIPPFLSVSTFFGVYVGLKYIDLTRRAVAENQGGQGEMAIYTRLHRLRPRRVASVRRQNMHYRRLGALRGARSPALALPGCLSRTSRRAGGRWVPDTANDPRRRAAKRALTRATTLRTSARQPGPSARGHRPDQRGGWYTPSRVRLLL